MLDGGEDVKRDEGQGARHSRPSAPRAPSPASRRDPLQISNTERRFLLEFSTYSLDIFIFLLVSTFRNWLPTAATAPSTATSPLVCDGAHAEQGQRQVTRRRFGFCRGCEHICTCSMHPGIDVPSSPPRARGPATGNCREQRSGHQVQDWVKDRWRTT